MQVKAEARYIRISPQKARLVVDLIRGQNAGAALTTLRTTNKRIAPAVEKVLQSAIANATNRSADVDVDQLVVSEAYVNEGPRMKRVRPAPMGRAYRYQRRIAHLEIVLDEKGAENREDMATVVGEETAAAPARKKLRRATLFPNSEECGLAAQSRVISPLLALRPSGLFDVH